MSMFPLLLVVSLFIQMSHGYPTVNSEEVVAANKIEDCREAFQLSTKYEEGITGSGKVDRYCESVANLSTCLDSPVIPEDFRRYFQLNLFASNKACEHYFNRPFNKCVKENHIELKKMYFEDLEKFVMENCGVEAMEDLEKNNQRIYKETKKHEISIFG